MCALYVNALSCMYAMCLVYVCSCVMYRCRYVCNVYYVCMYVPWVRTHVRMMCTYVARLRVCLLCLCTCMSVCM